MCAYVQWGNLSAVIIIRCCLGMPLPVPVLYSVHLCMWFPTCRIHTGKFPRYFFTNSLIFVFFLSRMVKSYIIIELYITY